MRIWLFQFADQTCAIQSARVAADDRIKACLALQPMLDGIGVVVALDGARPRPAEGVVLSYLGQGEYPAGLIISAQTRAGDTFTNEVAP